jgi:hypothetical protein
MLKNMQTWTPTLPVFCYPEGWSHPYPNYNLNKGIPTGSTSIKIPNKDIPIGYFNRRNTDQVTFYVCYMSVFAFAGSC